MLVGPLSFREATTMNSRLLALAESWREEAALIRDRYNDEPRAHLGEIYAAELERTIGEAENETLTLTQASYTSGYSTDHLGRMIREGKLPNAGRKGSPRIRVRDLPRKAGLPQDTSGPQLVRPLMGQVARSVLSRNGGQG
jgi:hypothetical protein